MTHIRAFEEEYEQAKGDVSTAKVKLREAEAALKAHPDYVAPEEEKSTNSQTKTVSKTK